MRGAKPACLLKFPKWGCAVKFVCEIARGDGGVCWGGGKCWGCCSNYQRRWKRYCRRRFSLRRGRCQIAGRGAGKELVMGRCIKLAKG